MRCFGHEQEQEVIASSLGVELYSFMIAFREWLIHQDINRGVVNSSSFLYDNASFCGCFQYECPDITLAYEVPT